MVPPARSTRVGAEDSIITYVLSSKRRAEMEREFYRRWTKIACRDQLIIRICRGAFFLNGIFTLGIILTRIACKVKPFAKVVQRRKTGLLDREQLLFDLQDGFRICIFYPFRQPVPFKNVEYDYAQENDKEKGDADLAEIADDRCDRTTEEVTYAREQHYPQEAADPAEHYESWIRHFTYAIEYAHRHTYAVYILGDHDGRRPEFFDQPFHSRLGHLIKAIVFGILMKDPPDHVSETVTDHAAQSSEDDHLQKAVWAKERAVGQHPRNKQRNIALYGAQGKYGINAILLDHLIERVLFHRGKIVSSGAKQRVTFCRSSVNKRDRPNQIVSPNTEPISGLTFTDAMSKIACSLRETPALTMVESPNQAKTSVGIDISTSGSTAVVIDGSNAIAATRSVSRSGEGNTVEEVAGLIAGLRSDGHSFDRVGIAVPGLVDRETGRVAFSANLPGHTEVDLVKDVEAATGVSVTLENDANAAAYGEFSLGAGRGSHDIFYVTLGEGVGGAFIFNGQIWRGASGFAGEFGYVSINSAGMRLEEVASSANIIRRTLSRFHQDNTSSLNKLTEESITLEDIITAAQRDDDFAQMMLGRTGRYVGTAVAGVINLLNIEKIVVGGEIMTAKHLVLDAIIDRARELSFAPAFQSTSIVEGELGSNAAAVGAAVLSRSGEFSNNENS